jgi:hypothetical protein
LPCTGPYFHNALPLGFIYPTLFDLNGKEVSLIDKLIFHLRVGVGFKHRNC